MAMESLNPVIHGSPQAAKAMSEDAEFELESSGTEGGAGSDVGAETDNRQPSNVDCETPSRGHSSQSVRSNYGRERREPNRYGVWV